MAMAGYIPEIKSFDATGFLNAFRAGSQDGREIRLDREKRDVGEAYRTGGYLAGSNAAMATGNFDLAHKLQTMGHDQQLRLYDALGRGATAADSPEKWAVLTSRLSSMFGPESIKGFEDFSRRGEAMRIALTAKEQAELRLRERELGFRGEELGIRRAEHGLRVGADAREAETHGLRIAAMREATPEGRAALFDRHFPPGAAEDATTRAERRARFIATGALPDKPESVKFTALPPGGELVAHDARTGRVLERYAGPDKPPDSTARRAMYEAMDELPSLRGTAEGLREALSLMDKAYHGFGSGTMTSLELGIPGGTGIVDRGRAEATRRLNDIMTSGAISAMASTLKGATTDTEMRKFVDLLADPRTSPEIKKQTIETMLRMAERQMRVKVDRVREIGGTIPPDLLPPDATFRPPGGRPGAPPPATGAPGGSPPDLAGLRRALESATPGTTYKFPNGETRVKGPDGNWYLPGEVPR